MGIAAHRPSSSQAGCMDSRNRRDRRRIEEEMKALWAVLGVLGLIVVVVLFAGGSYVSTKNTLVQKNEDVDRAYSQVNVVQQRRLDLIPNLVATVKGFTKEESTVLTNIAN